MSEKMQGRIHFDPQGLALTCMAHMQQEEAMLVETLDSLRQVRSALRGGDLESLKGALHQQERIANASAELQSRRAALRHEMAAALRVSPREVTMSRLATLFPHDVASRLLACRDRLSDLAAEVDQINRANAALVGQSLDFLERFLMEMTAGSTGSVGYSSSGVSRERILGSMIEAQG